MKLFPFFLRLEGRRILVIGGGDQALAKARLLQIAGAELTVIAEQLDEGFRFLSHFTYLARLSEPGDLDGFFAVFVATGDEASDRQIAAIAKEKKISVNVVDRPALGDIVMPAVIDRGALVVAISTGGASPVLTQIVRGMIEELLSPNFNRLVVFAAEFRKSVSRRITSLRARRLFWERILRGPIADLVLNGETKNARRLMIRDLNGQEEDEQRSMTRMPFFSYDEVTLGQARLLRRADAVLYPAGIDPAVFHLLRRDVRARMSGTEDENQEWLNDQTAQPGHIVILERICQERRVFG